LCVLLKVTVLKNQDLSTHFTLPFTNCIEEALGDFPVVGNDPVVSPGVVTFYEGDKNHVE